MGCGSCSTGGCGSKSNKPTGCGSKGDCLTGGCGKLNAFDWLSNMELPQINKFDIVEVRFKSGRKDFYRNSSGLELFTGDLIAVESSPGFHIGSVSLQGELVRLQMKKKKIKADDKIPSILRKANDEELAKMEESRNKEMTTMYRAREIITTQKLQMKLSDVEFQADGLKATFYYSADKRVDFRELIKILASEFKIRVEMRQISLRQEAARLGGIGSCGRELCCTTWLSDFKSVTTSAARYQNLSLNPAKLSGQCGRLKCCLNYELDTYMDALVDIPNIKAPIETQKGKAVLQKVDIFKKVMWFCYEGENTWHPIPASRVAEVIEANKAGQKPSVLIDRPIAEKKDKPLEFELSAGLERTGKRRKPTNKRTQPANKRSGAPSQPSQSRNPETKKQSIEPLNLDQQRDKAPHKKRRPLSSNKPPDGQSPNTPGKPKQKRKKRPNQTKGPRPDQKP